ncbi:MAG TPA: hypothetical protein VGM06_13750 [Polyangiaceae bacterium]|jgi:hypothetical protein
MSSERNGQKPDPSEHVPPSGSGRRASARAPSIWGAVRGALAAVHNLEALLRSASVPYRTILDLMPELRASATVLRDAFERARCGDAPTAEVGDYGNARTTAFEQLLDAVVAAGEPRDELANRAHVLADDLDASADLLALLERASAPVATEVSINLVARETGRMSGAGRGRELPVRLDEASPDCVVHTDPYVVGPLLSLAVASAQAAGLGELVVRARCSSQNATLLVEAASAADASLPIVSIRTLPAIPPAERAARRVADQIGALLLVEPARWAIALVSTGG